MVRAWEPKEAGHLCRLGLQRSLPKQEGEIWEEYLQSRKEAALSTRQSDFPL